LFADFVTTVEPLQKMKQMNIDDWDNVRVPRPFEENFGVAEGK